MLRVIALTAAAALVSSAALAADQLYGPTPQQDYVPFTPYDWSGLYGGIQGGGGWADADATFTVGPVTRNSTYDLDGWLFGLQIGNLWQYNMLVLGVQADAAWADISGNDGGALGAIDSVETNYLASATVRAGVAIDMFQPYVLGGVAFADYDYTLSNLANTATESHGDSTIGGTAGAGVEIALTDRLSAFGEYRHYWFEGDAIAFAGPGAIPPVSITPDLDIDTATVGLNWRF